MAIKRRETNDGARYDVQWRLPDRSKRKKTFKTERDARQFEAKLVTDSAAGVRIAALRPWVARASISLGSPHDPTSAPRSAVATKTTGDSVSNRNSAHGRSEKLIINRFSNG